MRNTRGFTLIELLYTVGVAALVLGIGVPSFIDQVRSTRMSAATNTLLTALYVARSEAVKQRARITVCRSDLLAPPSCDATGAGYLVFLNEADDISFDEGDGDVVLRHDQWLRGEIEIAFDGLPNGITYVSSGFTRAVGGGPLAGDLLFCDGRGETAARLLRIPTTGRPQIVAYDDVVGAPECPR
jgi:type IV fimbrial biogenesis protein FimT